MKKRFQCRKNLLASAIATALASSAGLPSVTWAQTAYATLRGKAAANSEVVAKNLATGATRRTKAGADGAYSLPGLQPGTYRVDAGPGTETTITLTVASTATVNLAAGAGATPEGSLSEILVMARRPIEVKTSEIGATVSLQQIETIPQLTRNFLEFADTVPGLVFSVDEKGNPTLRGGAQNIASVNVYIDGVGQKDYVKGAGVSGQFFTQGNPFPQLAIGEYKVITSNYKAEFDQVSSAAVTAETKSGTNEFHGEVFGTYTSDKFRAETPSEANAGMKTPSKDKEFGIAVGGPIIQDHLHFFLTYEGKRFNTPITVVPGQNATSVNGIPVTSLLPASVLAQLGPASLPFTENLVFGKVDWEISDFDRFEVSAKNRSETQVDGIGAGNAASASINKKNDDTRLTARWQHSADRWLNNLLFTYEDSFNSPTSVNTGNGAVYAIQSNNDQGVLTTGSADPRGTQHKGQRGPALQDDLTLSDLHWLGDHTVKTGVKVKDVTLTAADAEDTNPQFYYNVTPAGTDTQPYRVFFTNPVPGLSSTVRSKDTQFGVYFQDDWVANEHLTWNLGVRWDYEKTPSYLNQVTPANVVAALNGPDPNAPGQTYAQSLAKGGVNVNDYISNGHNRSAYTGEFQPRLGFSVDLNADQKHVVFGGYGRSYDRDLYDFLQLEQTKSALPNYFLNFQQPGTTTCLGGRTPCFAWDPKFLTGGLPTLQALVGASNTGQEVDILNNHLKAPYADQFSLGMRNRVGDWNTSASVARILSYDGFVFTLGNRYPNGAFWMNGGQPWGNGVPGFGPLIIGNNGIETKTTQLLLSAEKPYTEESGWGLTVAYTFTDAKQNRDINEHYSFDEETIKQYPFIRSNATARHRLVTSGSIRGPWRTVFAGKLTLATPIPVNDLACFGASYPTGSNCTPISATPKNTFGYRSLDLQATKNFDVASYATVYARLDLLNAFNFGNYKDTNNNWGANGVANPNPVTYNYIGNIFQPPRTLRLTVGAKF